MKKKTDLIGNLDIVILLTRLSEAEKYFTKKEYVGINKRAEELFERGEFTLCKKELDKLPNSAQLLETLVSKLKDKHLYKTLRKIQEGKVPNDLLTAKGLSSLLTHVIIEVEQGNNEYKVLIPVVAEKLNEIIYSTLR